MPYALKPTNDGKYLVVNSQTNVPTSRRPMSQDRAKRYLAALMQNVPDVKRNRISWLQKRITNRLKELDSPSQNFYVIKEASGLYRWITFSSSNFLDRDNEIVSKAAMERDVAYSDAHQDYGPLLWWHLDGKEGRPFARLGEGDFNGLEGGVLIESGHFDTPEIGKAFSAIASELGVSIGFMELEREGNVYKAIRRTERSLLPKEVASNRLTKLSVVTKGDKIKMKLDVLKEKLLAAGFGEADSFVSGLQKDAQTKEQQARQQGLVQKQADTITISRAELVAIVKAAIEDEASDETKAVLPAAAKKPEAATTPPANAEANENMGDIQPVDDQLDAQAGAAAQTALVGDMTQDGLQDLVLQVVAAAFQHYLGEQMSKMLDTKMTGLADSIGKTYSDVREKLTTKEANDATIVKGVSDRMTFLEKKLNALDGTVPTGVKEAAQAGYRASGDSATIVPGADKVLKEAEAAANPGGNDPWFQAAGGLFGKQLVK